MKALDALYDFLLRRAFGLYHPLQVSTQLHLFSIGNKTYALYIGFEEAIRKIT